MDILLRPPEDERSGECTFSPRLSFEECLIIIWTGISMELHKMIEGVCYLIFNTDTA